MVFFCPPDKLGASSFFFVSSAAAAANVFSSSSSSFVLLRLAHQLPPRPLCVQHSRELCTYMMDSTSTVANDAHYLFSVVFRQQKAEAD